MKRIIGVTITAVILSAVILSAYLLARNPERTSAQTRAAVKSIHEITVKDIDGKSFKLDRYKGNVILIVNVASQCGYTPQYEGLQKLYEKYQSRGFVILGFPANNFGGQEPGSEAEIKEFCSSNYNVKFPMFSKVSAAGADIHPLYKYLTEKETNPQFAGKITWNFNKFLIDRTGKPLARFETSEKPESARIAQAIESALK